MVNIIDIKKWMKKNLVKVKKDENIVNAAKLMSKKNVGSLIVTSKGVPRGIITTTDILKRVVAKNKDLKETLVKDVMTKKLVKAPSNLTFSALARKMREYKIKHIAITEKGKVIGMITSTDIITLMSGK